VKQANLLMYITPESVPETNRYWELRVKFQTLWNNGSLSMGSNQVWQASADHESYTGPPIMSHILGHIASCVHNEVETIILTMCTCITQVIRTTGTSQLILIH